MAQGEKNYPRDNTLDAGGLLRLRSGPFCLLAALTLLSAALVTLPEDLQNAPEVLITDQELAFGVQVANPVVGGNDSDLGPSVGSLSEGADHELNLVGDPGFQLVSPTVRLGHDALRRS
jgi:hypothetical protein